MKPPSPLFEAPWYRSHCTQIGKWDAPRGFVSLSTWWLPAAENINPVESHLDDTHGARIWSRPPHRRGSKARTETGGDLNLPGFRWLSLLPYPFSLLWCHPLEAQEYQMANAGNMVRCSIYFYSIHQHLKRLQFTEGRYIEQPEVCPSCTKNAASALPRSLMN